MAENPFETIESAQQYLHLLLDEIREARDGIGDDIVDAQSDRADRRLDALHIVEYKLKQLEQHLATSARILNDLRKLHRLLMREGMPDDADQ